MFQFSEVLTLAIGLVLLAYLLAHRRRIADLPSLRPFVPAVMLLLLSWISTVAEGLFIEDVPPENVIQFWQKSVGLAVKGGAWSQALNWIEHLSALAASVWLFVAALRIRRANRERAS